jgi:predicted DNA binding protein
MAYNTQKDQESGFEVIEVIGEVRKNKTDVIRASKVKFKGNEYKQIQVWRTSLETETVYPMKNSNIIARPEVMEKLAELLLGK